MFDILSEMFARPGNAFSALPFWFWNDRLDRDELVRQVDDFHKKGVNGFVIHPRMGMEVEGGYMGETYLDMVRPGLLLYGYGEEARRLGLRPVMT